VETIKNGGGGNRMSLSVVVTMLWLNKLRIRQTRWQEIGRKLRALHGSNCHLLTHCSAASSTCGMTFLSMFNRRLSTCVETNGCPSHHGYWSVASHMFAHLVERTGNSWPGKLSTQPRVCTCDWLLNVLLLSGQFESIDSCIRRCPQNALIRLGQTSDCPIPCRGHAGKPATPRLIGRRDRA
jgi:hypothetical protein